MAKLLTHHDPNHLHAACGLIALIHWIYRYYLLCLDVDYGGFGRNPRSDIICMAIEMLPNITSFIFTIVPVKKGLDGFTIWKEYRWHAFIFALKLWLLQAMHLYAIYFVPGKKLKYNFYYRAALEFGTMLAAQYSTNLYPKQTSTIRGMYKQGWSVFLAGFGQFIGRGALLFGTLTPRDNIPLCIISIFIIQLNAFNMTLRKKRIIGPRSSQAFYSVMLISGFYMLALRRFWAEPPTGFFDHRFKLFYVASLAYYCRRSGFDRFSSWIVALTTVAIADQQFNLFQEPTDEFLS